MATPGSRKTSTCCSADEARPNAVRGRYGHVEVTFIGLADLVRNKQATPRTKDRGDVEELTQQD